MHLGSTVRSAGTSCRPHDRLLAQRASRVKAAAARSASLDAARTMGDPDLATTQLLIRSPRGSNCASLNAASPTLARAPPPADTSAVGTSLTLLEAIQKEPGRIAGLSGHFGPVFKAGGPLVGIKIPSDACSAPCGSVFVQRGPLQRARISGAAPSGRVGAGVAAVCHSGAWVDLRGRTYP